MFLFDSIYKLLLVLSCSTSYNQKKIYFIRLTVFLLGDQWYIFLIGHLFYSIQSISIRMIWFFLCHCYAFIFTALRFCLLWNSIMVGYHMSEKIVQPSISSFIYIYIFLRLNLAYYISCISGLYDGYSDILLLYTYVHEPLGLIIANILYQHTL